MKKQESKKMKRDFWTSGQLETFQYPDYRVPEGEEQQEVENLFEQMMKKNFPNLVKEIDFQEVQEAQSPKEAGPKEEHTKAYHY